MSNCDEVNQIRDVAKAAVVRFTSVEGRLVNQESGTSLFLFLLLGKHRTSRERKKTEVK